MKHFIIFEKRASEKPQFRLKFLIHVFFLTFIFPKITHWTLTIRTNSTRVHKTPTGCFVDGAMQSEFKSFQIPLLLCHHMKQNFLSQIQITRTHYFSVYLTLILAQNNLLNLCLNDKNVFSLNSSSYIKMLQPAQNCTLL